MLCKLNLIYFFINQNEKLLSENISNITKRSIDFTFSSCFCETSTTEIYDMIYDLYQELQFNIRICGVLDEETNYNELKMLDNINKKK